MQHPLRVWAVVVACSGAGGTLLGSQLRKDVPEMSAPTAKPVSPSSRERNPAHTGATPHTSVASSTSSPMVLLNDADVLSSVDDWWPRQVLVRATTIDALNALADEVQAEVVHSAAVDGLGVLLLPEGVDEQEAVAGLLGHPSVVDAARHGIVRLGRTHAAVTVPPDSSLGPARWLQASAERSETRATARSWVAVLDTGLAYASGWAQTAALGQTEFVAAPSLVETPLVDPWDYLRQSAHPVDEHQQGTHVASLIASGGAMEGLASGAAILPYKVLDAAGQGTELALIDALYWSAWADVDVVHMGLSFSDAYHPSEALLEALGYVDAVGAVMVSAAGDGSEMGSTWPAASPVVVSVGASCPGASGLELAPYSNEGGDVDLLAPGGCLDRDVNQDGLPDGVVAESFPLNDPSRPGPILMEGTGQAAAMVSAGAVQLLEHGVAAGDVRALLQAGAAPIPDTLQGAGVGTLRIDGALEAVSNRTHLGSEAGGFGVGLTPWRKVDRQGGTRPAARILVVDARGRPVSGARVYGHFRGTTASSFSCETNLGTCDVEGQATTDDLVGWSVTVAAVGVGAARYAPSRVAVGDTRTVTALRALADHFAGTLSFGGGRAPVGRRDPGGVVDGLGELAPAVVFEGGGDGRIHPYGIIVSPQLLQLMGVVSEESVGAGRHSQSLEVSTISLPGGHTVYAIHRLDPQPGAPGILSPEPGEPSCLGTEGCPSSVVLASGAVVGAARGRALQTLLGARPALHGLRASVETWNRMRTD